MMLWRFTRLLAVFMALAQTSHAVDGVPKTTSISQWNINIARQEATSVLSSSTSSFNWWPYPPGGVTTSMSNPVASTTTATPASSSTDTDTSLTSSNASTMASTTSSSLSITHITAQPPANTTSTTNVHKFKQSSSSLHTIYLVPVFAILGIILGSVTTWLCYGCIKTRRGPRQRADSLEPGPAYQATLRDDDWVYDEKDERMTLHGDEGSPSKRSRHGSVYSRRSSGRGSWFGRALSLRSQGDKTFASSDDKLITDHDDANTLLAAPTTARWLSTRTKASTVGSIYTSPDVLSLMDDEDVDMLPYESLKRKRGILERLNSKTSRRSDEVELERAGSDMTQSSRGLSFRRSSRGHKRADSDFYVEELNRPARTHFPQHSPRKERDIVRRTGTEADETEWVEGSGFRIIEEHLDRMRDQVEGRDLEDGMRDPKIGQPQTPKKKPARSILTAGDKYTPLPVRRSPSKGRSPSATPVSTPRRIQRADSVLLMSPPQLMSPPLEDILFFQSPNQNVHMNEKKKTAGRMTSTATRSMKKPRSLAPSRLPVLALEGALSQNNRLTKASEEKDLPVSPPRKQTTNKTRPSSRRHDQRSTPTRRGTAAERFNARYDALSKVDQIVSRSWSQRDLSDLEKIGSPTMFGAQVDSVHEKLAVLEER